MSTENLQPFFSVIIPTYNRKVELESALNSVFNQTEGSFEVIVVDDHSTDGTMSWLESLKDPRLRMLTNKKSKGACGARNTGIEAANSAWIAFLDSDDYWYDTKLESFRKAIIQNPDYTSFYSACSYLKDNVIGYPSDLLRKNGDLRPFLGRKNKIGGTSVLVTRKDLLLKVGGFDETFPARQDIDIYMRLSAVGNFYYLDEILVESKFESANKISFNINNRLNGWLKWYEKHGKSLKFSDRMYQQKRIFSFALASKKFLLACRYFPGAMISIIADFFSGKKKEINHDEP